MKLRMTKEPRPTTHIVEKKLLCTNCGEGLIKTHRINWTIKGEYHCLECGAEFMLEEETSAQKARGALNRLRSR